MQALVEIPHIRFHTTQHADAILESAFPDELQELADVLAAFRIEREELIRGGGGESSMTQRLRRALAEEGWEKRNVKEQYFIDDVEFEAESHEVDHLRTVDAGRIALEIEWNNKDPFFDRDLENFRKLHQIGYISVGVIITRGASLQANLRNIFEAHYSQFARVHDFDCTAPQRRSIVEKMDAGQALGEAAGAVLCASKFGTATTHWNKLIVRVSQRGLGKPCPLLLIGLEENVIVDLEEN